MAIRLLTAGKLLQRRWVGEPCGLCPSCRQPRRAAAAKTNHIPPPLCSLQGSSLRAAARAFAVGATRCERRAVPRPVIEQLVVLGVETETRESRCS